jgi:plastocyanin
MLVLGGDDSTGQPVQQKRHFAGRDVSLATPQGSLETAQASRATRTGPVRNKEPRATQTGRPGLKNADVSQTASVAGTVIYKTDPNRRWRYGRYYMKDQRTGHLAEAVIALKGPNLKGRAPTGEQKLAIIDQKNFRFLPETLAIRVGNRVKFTNSDPELHNVRSTGSLHPFNVSIDTGREFETTFKRAGGIGRPVRIGCVFHGSMRAWIYVFDHPFFQVSSADGSFLFSNVPPGRYRLEMVHPAGGLRWSQPIKVTPGSTLDTNIVVSPDHKEPRK